MSNSTKKHGADFANCRSSADFHAKFTFLLTYFDKSGKIDNVLKFVKKEGAFFQ